MELEKINENKMKIILTADECADLKLSFDGGIDTREVRAALKRILKGRGGFDIEAERMLLRLYPRREGGAELFLTKISHSGAMREDEWEEGPSRRGGSIYRFLSRESLDQALTAIGSEGIRLYRYLLGGYLLISAGNPESGAGRELFAEFGEPIKEPPRDFNAEWYTELRPTDPDLFLSDSTN